MTIVTTSYRPKRAPRKKRKQPPIANRIVTPAPLKPRKGPVIRLKDQTGEAQTIVTPDSPSDGRATETKRSAIVEPKRKRSSIFGPVPDYDPEEHRRRGEAAGELWHELVRRATTAS